MPTLLYHKQAFGFPAGLVFPHLTDLILCPHVKQRATERHIPLALLTSFDPTTCPVFQVDMEDGQMVRFNYRRRMDNDHDYNAVIDPHKRMVVSAWVHHRLFRVSINRMAYARPAK